MTDYTFTNTTGTSPRSGPQQYFRDSTPIESVRETELSSLTERLETLVNETGQLRAEVEDRPFKYTVQLYDLGDPDYRLSGPIAAVIEEYQNEEVVFACFPEVEVFGEGNTQSEAIINLKFAVLDLYDELKECDPGELGDLPRAWLRALDHMIIRA